MVYLTPEDQIKQASNRQGQTGNTPGRNRHKISLPISQLNIHQKPCHFKLTEFNVQHFDNSYQKLPNLVGQKQRLLVLLMKHSFEKLTNFIYTMHNKYETIHVINKLNA